MKISLIDPSLFTLPYDRALAGGLQQLGHQVTLHGRRLGPDDPSAGDLIVEPDFYRVAQSRFGLRLPRPVRLPLKGLDHAWSMQRLVRRLRGERPDVIHFQWLPLPLIDNAMLRRLSGVASLVLTVHDTNPFNGDPSAALQTRAIASCMAQFGRLIVHTAQGWSRLREQGIPANRIVQLPHGLLSSSPEMSKAGGGAASAVAEGGDPLSGVLTLVLFGKIKPYKGADLLIEAFGRLPDAVRRQARVRIVGKSYMDLTPLRALADRLGVSGSIELEDRFVADEEIDGLFGPATIAVFPYREIEASGVFFMALAQGRPVIASNLGSFAETMADGREGHLVPPGDVDQLTAAISHMITDRSFASRCGQASRAVACAVPGWVEIAERTVAVYRDAALTRSSVDPIARLDVATQPHSPAE
jgi:glycosyltransferase involved in cell wall biosynthesis